MVAIPSVLLVVLLSWWLWVVVSSVAFCIVMVAAMVVVFLFVGVLGVGVIIMVRGQRCVIGSLSSLLVEGGWMFLPGWRRLEM